MSKRGQSSGFGGGGAGNTEQAGLPSANIAVTFRNDMTPRQVDSALTKLADERERVKREWQKMAQDLSEEAKSGSTATQDLAQRISKINDWYGEAMEEIYRINDKFKSQYGVGL